MHNTPAAAGTPRLRSTSVTHAPCCRRPWQAAEAAQTTSSRPRLQPATAGAMMSRIMAHFNVAARRVLRPARLTIALVVAGALLPLAGHAQLLTLTRDQLIEYTKQNPFERFPDGRPKVPDGLIERARAMSAEEVFAILPGEGFRNQYEDGFQVLHPGKKLVGRAFTVQFMPLRPDLDGAINAKAQAAGLGRMYNQVAIDM